MKYIKEYLKDVIRIKPLGELTTKDDILVGMSGEMVYIDDKCADIFISHADYANWLESKYEQKPYGQRKECLDCQFNYAGECKGSCAMKRSEQNHVDKAEPKFKVGDWVVIKANGNENVRQIVNIEYFATGQPQYISSNGLWFGNGTEARLWTIQDAKDGDVLDANGAPFIYKRHDKDYVYFYCGINLAGDFIEANENDIWNNNNKVYPATKEQRDTLMKAMADAGYTFDFEKKELRKIEQNPIPKFKVGDNIRRKAPSSYDKDMQVARIEKDYYVCNHIGKFSSEVVPFSKESSYELIGQEPTAWGEEDEVKINRIVACLENLNVADNDILLKDVDWLKSLRPQNTWKPSDEQMKALKEACDKSCEPDGLDPLYTLYEQLKKLKG